MCVLKFPTVSGSIPDWNPRSKSKRNASVHHCVAEGQFMKHHVNLSNSWTSSTVSSINSSRSQFLRLKEILLLPSPSCWKAGFNRRLGWVVLWMRVHCTLKGVDGIFVCNFSGRWLYWMALNPSTFTDMAWDVWGSNWSLIWTNPRQLRGLPVKHVIRCPISMIQRVQYAVLPSEFLLNCG